MAILLIFGIALIFNAGGDFAKKKYYTSFFESLGGLYLLIAAIGHHT